jgi:hypothetical protein
MKYRSIVKAHMATSCQRVYLICGGSEAIRQDALMMLKKIIKQTFRWTYFRSYCSRMYTLKEVVDEPEKLLYRTEFNVFYITWKSGLLDEKQAKEFFRMCSGVGARRHVIIVAESPKLSTIFEKVYGKGSRGKTIECVLPVDDKVFANYVSARTEVFGMEVTKEIIKLLMTLPTTSMLNVFNILRYVKKDERNISDMMKMNLFRDSLEYELAEELIEKGKNAVLKHPGLDNLNAKMFFGAVQMRLIRILTIKSSAEQYGKQRDKMKLPPPVFKKYWGYAQKFDSRILLERLRLLLMLRRYSKYHHSVLILLNHW